MFTNYRHKSSKLDFLYNKIWSCVKEEEKTQFFKAKIENQNNS